jgi:hypothetical protein
VEAPAHGALTGTAPNLVYVPAPGYYGPDRFRFVADDGQSPSGVATVHITVRMDEFVLYADEGAVLGARAQVHRGGIGVNRAASGVGEGGGAELSIAAGAKLLEATSRVVADTIQTASGSQIYNPSYNELEADGAVLGSSVSPIVLPYQPLPALPDAFAPGTQDRSVPAVGTQTLAAGAYGSLEVGQNATLRLTGGVYHVQDVTLAEGSKVHVLAPSEIRVAGRWQAAASTYLGPDPSAGGRGETARGPAVEAGQILLYVAGGNGGAGGQGASPGAVEVGDFSSIHAYVVAPGGTVRLGDYAAATGGYHGRWVDARADARLAIAD